MTYAAHLFRCSRNDWHGEGHYRYVAEADLPRPESEEVVHCDTAVLITDDPQLCGHVMEDVGVFELETA